MGHVPTGSIPAEGSGAQLQRRQHRRIGAWRPTLTDRYRYRQHVGRAGEAAAAGFLRRAGAEIEAHNVVIDRGEIDLIVRFGDLRAAIEVKAIRSESADADHDPLEHVDHEKSRQVARLAKRAGCQRVDLVGVVFTPEGVLIRWVPNTG